jgi:hypothetical protein
VTGPVECCEFARFAAICASVAMKKLLLEMKKPVRRDGRPAVGNKCVPITSVAWRCKRFSVSD